MHKLSPIPSVKELLALYQITAQDLAFFKAQQWSLTNYCSLALAAIVGITQLPSVSLTPWIRIHLAVAASAVVFMAVWILWRLHSSIEDRHQRLARLFPQLSERFRSVRGEKATASANEMFIFFILLLALGLGLVWWLIFI